MNHLGQAAAMLLLLELWVLLLVFLAISGGLAFGLHWGRGKTDPLFGKVNGFIPQVRHVLRVGLGYAARPVILVSGFTATLWGTIEAMKRQVQARSMSHPPPVGVTYEPPPPLPQTVATSGTGRETP